jgi:hypothetical protein
MAVPHLLTTACAERREEKNSPEQKWLSSSRCIGSRIDAGSWFPRPRGEGERGPWASGRAGVLCGRASLLRGRVRGGGKEVAAEERERRTWPRSPSPAPPCSSCLCSVARAGSPLPVLRRRRRPCSIAVAAAARARLLPRESRPPRPAPPGSKAGAIGRDLFPGCLLPTRRGRAGSGHRDLPRAAAPPRTSIFEAVAGLCDPATRSAVELCNPRHMVRRRRVRKGA